jgi:ADP-ribosyl-[dinitrogen reductase] hydrolase
LGSESVPSTGFWQKQKETEMKTSQTHPLQIDTVKAGNGEIGLTFCPGKKQENSYSGTWNRDLNADLEEISKWGAVALVTLIEDHEFIDLSVPDLEDKAEGLGLEWYHLPIKDVSIPRGDFRDAWAYSGHRLRSLLRAGKKIVIHCKGGLGRTGIIAGRLMIELGQVPIEVIDAIRMARPGSIETSEQEVYVRQISRRTVSDEDNDRILGSLLGGAVGDAFGYEVEFDKLLDIQSRFGTDGIQEAVFHDGKFIVSDDTQMTMFTLEGIQRSRLDDPEDINEQIRLAYLDWLSTQLPALEGWEATGLLYKVGSLRHSRAPGGTCLSALKAGGWGTPDKHINNSKGCGGVMRVAPIGFVHQWSPEQAFDIAANAAAITHGHPSGFLSAAAMAAIVRMLLDGTDLPAATEQTLSMLSVRPDHQETTDAMMAALKAWQTGSSDHIAKIGSLGEGWIGEEALAIALYAALAGNSFSEVLAIGANHDGDSDSTASIAGQLYGTWKGLSDLPNAWVRRLDVFDPMMAPIKNNLE